MSAISIDPETVASEGLFVVQSHQHSLTDELHVIYGGLLCKAVYLFQLLYSYSVHELIDQDMIGPADAQDIVVLKTAVGWVVDGENSSLSYLDIWYFVLTQLLRPH